MRYNYRFFTEAEDAVILEMLDYGFGTRVIADALGRYVGSVSNRAKLLNRETPPKNPKKGAACMPMMVVVLCGECARWQPGEIGVDGWSGQCEACGADTYRTTKCVSGGDVVRRKEPVMLDPDEIDARLPFIETLERVLGGGCSDGEGVFGQVQDAEP